jgi:16S rRNA (guanine527-N7)-methyltransferase
MVRNVILDSLSFLAALPSQLGSLVDIGSGAGIPGIPLAIVRRSVAVTLVESRRRRASFLSSAKRELDLANVTILDARAETLGPEYAGRFDAAVMRCAGPLRELLPVAIGLVHPGGVIVAAAAVAAPVPDQVERIVVELGTPREVRAFHRLTRP